MPVSLIDSHAHLDFSDFDDDRIELIKQLEQKAIGVINPATTVKSNLAIDRLTKSQPSIWGAVGLHPTDIKEDTLTKLPTLIDSWKELIANNPKIVAVGEIGLDYYHQNSQEQANRQRSALRQLVTFALEVKLPVIFHCRDAYGDLLTLLADYPDLKGVIHCFNGSLVQAQAFIYKGFQISFTAIIGYPKNQDLREVVKTLPLESMLVETDSPFLAPQSIRGNRNDPTQVLEVVAQIGQIKGISTEEVKRATLENTQSLFGLTNN
jgi:TatD DNase family protein